MYEFEKTEVGFAHEKDKESKLRQIEVFIKRQIVPTTYLRAAFNFLVGCLWIKFSPIFPVTHDCISAILIYSTMEDKEYFIKRQADIIEKTIWLV